MDVVVDLDGTLVSPRKSATAPPNLLHGAAEFLQALAAIPGMRISFFSGAPELWNDPHVRSITAAFPDQVLWSSPRIFSKQHLALPGERKRLAGLASDLNVEETIIVDDTGYRYAFAGEERNFLHVYAGYSSRTWHCGALAMASREDNKLVRALGMVLWSLQVRAKSKCSLVEALTAIQWDGKRYRHEETNVEEVYRLGLAAMRRINPEFELLDRKELGFLPWSRGVLEFLGMDDETEFARNFYEQEQVDRIVVSSVVEKVLDLSMPEVITESLIEEKAAGCLEVEVCGGDGGKKRKKLTLPAGVPAKVVVDTINFLYMVKKGTLTDGNGEAVPCTLDHRLAAGSYSYAVLVAARV